MSTNILELFMTGRSTLLRSLLPIAVCIAASSIGCAEEIPLCRTHADALMLPTPVWEVSGSALTPPEGDRAVALLSARPQWQLDAGELDGWPRRPTILVALDGEATDIDPSGVTLWESGPDGRKLEIESEVKLLGEATLWIQPVHAIPLDVSRLTVAIAPTTTIGAHALPACDSSGDPHPAYAEAAAELPSGTDVAVAVSFPLSDGVTDLPALYNSLVEAPALAVASAEPRALDSFGIYAPSGEIATALQPEAIDGILELPAYQNDEGRFELDARGVPIAQGITRPGFTVVLPAAGTAPYPFVLYQHGGSQKRHNVLQLARPLAEAGFALVAIDLPSHGDRKVGGGTVFDFIDLQQPLRTRDNMRQASADHLAVVTGVDALNAALVEHSGDAVTLDPDRVHYMGLSVGGLTGSLTFSSAASIDAAALFVAGAGFGEFLSGGLFALLLRDVLPDEPDELAASLALTELLLGDADPAAYPIVEHRDTTPRPLLLFAADQDHVVPQVSSNAWAVVFGTQLARPVVHAVPGMEDVALPHAGGFSFDGSEPSATRLLIQAPMADVEVSDRHEALIVADYSQQLVTHCWVTLGDTGWCEAIDTGFGDVSE